MSHDFSFHEITPAILNHDVFFLVLLTLSQQTNLKLM